jgi:hypothetical protein
VTNPSDALLIGGLIALTVIIVGLLARQVINDFKMHEPPASVQRFGYLIGEPSSVQCSVCGSACHCAAHFRRERQVWTEWRCPKCTAGKRS